MIRYINGLRYRLARLLAPDPIVAAPLGDGEAFVLFRPKDSPDSWVWFEAATLDLRIEHDIAPLGDTYGRANFGAHGEFHGTIKPW